MNSQDCKDAALRFVQAAQEIAAIAKEEEGEVMRDMIRVAELSLTTAQVYATLATVLDPISFESL